MNTKSAEAIGEDIATSPTALVSIVMKELKLKPDRSLEQKLKDEIFCFLYFLTDYVMFSLAEDSLGKISRDALVEMIYPPALVRYARLNDKTFDEVIELIKVHQMKRMNEDELYGQFGAIYKFVLYDLCENIAKVPRGSTSGLLLYSFFSRYSTDFMRDVYMIATGRLEV